MKIKRNTILAFSAYIIAMFIYMLNFLLDDDKYRNLLGKLSALFYFLIIFSTTVSILTNLKIINYKNKGFYKLYFIINLIPIIFAIFFLIFAIYQLSKPI